ncbi:MAG: outer membrane protein assembly factor BamA [Proteobacteria bacterium]|nr:outer membrane protein assembly factor BamA [Pseudomonadota bacterium]
MAYRGQFGLVRLQKTVGRLIPQVLIAVMLFGAVTWFNAGAAKAQQYRFSSIDVVGNLRIESSTIRSYAGISTAKSLSAADLNAAYQSIASSGLFEEVEIVPNGARLVIKVKEFPTINRVAFEGNSRIKDEVLAGLVKSQTRRVFNPTEVEKDRAVIAEAYANSGRLAAKVNPKFIRLSDNRVDLVFEIFEGGLVEIERISFVGNRAYSDRKLRSVLETKQAGLLRTFIQRDTFVEDRIEFDKQVLSDFYKSRGYADFRINSVNAEISQERDAYFITFNIREGQKFTVGQIDVTTDLSGIDSKAFARAGKVRTGQTYSPLAIENDITRMERFANQEGLEFLRITPRISRNDASLSLDVNYVIERGPRIFVERIDIEGNTATLDRVIRRQFRIVEGDPFNPSEIRSSARRIRALGFFSNADVTSREGSNPEQVVVDVKVEEAPTGSLSFGASYSTAAGAGGLVEYSERNFLGRGQALSLKLTAGTGNQTYSFDFTEPAFLYNDLSLSILTSYAETQRQFSQYNTSALKIRPQLSFPLSEQTRLGVRYQYAESKLSNASLSTGAVIGEELALGNISESGLGYTLSFDSRRTGLDPDAGVLARIEQDFSGLGGDTTSLKTTGLISGEMKVLGEEVTLIGTIEGGMLSYSKGQSRVVDRFQLGSGIMRGFEPGGIGPREYDSVNGVNDALGGDKFAAVRLEALFPIGLPEEYGITGGVFYDVGNLWGLEYNSADIQYEKGAWRQAAGVSIIWITPVGPFRFNFSRAIAKELLDTANDFELTLATRRF